MEILIVVAAIVAVLVLWILVSYNSLVKGKLKCEEAFSTMDVYLKKRFDLIPNLVSTVKGYAKHESETLEKVISARNSGIARTTEEKIADDNNITASLRQIFALAENYPELKANTNFLNLMEQLKSVEEDIANARKYYNGTVRQYNESIMMVPKNIVAGMFHFTKQPMYTVDEAAERKNVKVDF